MNTIFQKFATNCKIILVAVIALFIAVNAQNDTITAKNNTAINAENDITVNNHTLNYITPLHYEAKIRFNYERNDVIGECNITIDINRQTNNISIYSMNFIILKIALYDNNLNEEIYIPRYSFNYETYTYVIDITNVSKHILPRKYILGVSYIRHIHNNKKSIFELFYPSEELNTM